MKRKMKRKKNVIINCGNFKNNQTANEMQK